jgi:hypothetical protein
MKESIMYARPAMGVRQFLDSLREGPFSSVGSYPKYWVTADGCVLSYKACKENALQIARSIRQHLTRPGYDGWTVVGVDANWEDPAMYCDHTGERIALRAGITTA